MSERIKVLGMEIDNVSVMDAMGLVEEFINTEPLSILAVISAGMLLKAGEDLQYKEKIEHLSLGIIGEKEVLEAAGIQDPERHMEVENNWFLASFLEYAAVNQKKAVVFCEKAVETAALSDYVETAYPELEVVGKFFLEDMTQDADSILNLINGTSTDIIIASLGIPEQENFVFENSSKLNAKIWLGLGKSLNLKKVPELKTGFLEKLIEKRIFKKKISRYQQEEEES